MLRETRRTSGVALALAVVTLAMVLPASAGSAAGVAPMFALEGLDGKPVDLAAYKGSPIILLFWAPW